MEGADMKSSVIAIDTDAIPEYVRDTMAQTLLNSVRSFFSDPDHEAGYRQWLAERKKKQHAPAAKHSTEKESENEQ